MARARPSCVEATAGAGRSPKLDVINGLRGIAICGVVWQHLFSVYFKPGSGHYLFDAARAPYFFLSYGWIGVQLFFLLSGFVLFLPIAEGRAALATRRDWLAFYRRRAQRLLPLYYIAALLCLVLNQDAPVQETKFLLELGAIAGALFTFSPHGFEPYFNPPLWSLGVEIWFSILFPAIVLALRRLGAVRLVVLALVIGCVSRYLGNVLPAEGPLGVQPLTIGLPASLEIFIAGMVLAELFAARPRGLPLLRRPALVFLSGMLVVGIAVSLQQLSSADLAVPILFPDILTLGFALMAAALLSMPAGALKALFANRPIQLLGMMCFSLYVWHEPLLRHVFKADMAPLDGLARTLPAYLGLLLTVGALSYRYIEFGRVADWRALFLLERKREAVAAPAPVAAVADQTATGASL